MSRRQRVTKVIHPARPELGVGEVNDVVQGKPLVLQVYWPEPEKYGYYPISDLRRLRKDGQAEETAPTEAPEL